MATREIKLYTDYKSPYAFLAVRPAYALEIEHDVRIEWLPLVLEIPEFLGSVESRNEHQWRRVRYSYMDARRLANRVGLTIRGPKKIFDSSLAAYGLLYAKQQDVFKTYNDITFDRFWKRELDIEDLTAITQVLVQAGADVSSFDSFCQGEGPDLVRQIRHEANDFDVFGVPTFVLDGEAFWGTDRIALLKERLHTSS
ncbi:MAG: DsbA family protein [Hyphomicrobiaceae bacterium]